VIVSMAELAAHARAAAEALLVAARKLERNERQASIVRNLAAVKNTWGPNTWNARLQIYGRVCWVCSAFASEDALHAPAEMTMAFHAKTCAWRCAVEEQEIT
jgi:hypothetical protein